MHHALLRALFIFGAKSAPGAADSRSDRPRPDRAAEGLPAGAKQPSTQKPPGRLQIVHPGGPGLTDRYVVRDSETGKDAGVLTGDDAIELPAGIYTVGFPTGDWTGIEIRNAQTTKLPASVVCIDPKGDSHGLRDPETGAVLTMLEASRDSRGVVMPGHYDVEFCGGTLTMPIYAEAGIETIVVASAIRIAGGFDGVIALHDEHGRHIGEFRDGFGQTKRSHVVPAGNYVLEYLGSTMDVDAVAGKIIEIKMQ